MTGQLFGAGDAASEIAHADGSGQPESGDDTAVEALRAELDDLRERERHLTHALRQQRHALDSANTLQSEDAKEVARLTDAWERADGQRRKWRRRADDRKAIYESAEAALARTVSVVDAFVRWTRDDLATRSRAEWARLTNDLAALAGLPPDNLPDLDSAPGSQEDRP